MVANLVLFYRMCNFYKKLQKIKINIYIAKIYKNPLLKFIFISFTELNLNNFNSGFDDFPIVGESFLLEKFTPIFMSFRPSVWKGRR